MKASIIRDLRARLRTRPTDEDSAPAAGRRDGDRPSASAGHQAPPEPPQLLSPEVIAAGINGELEGWLSYNLAAAADRRRTGIAPFPPMALMHVTSSLTSELDFASHGVDLGRALERASPRKLSELGDLLDFGVGVGRLARMFLGYGSRYVGVDVDARNIAWVAQALPHVEAHLTQPAQPLPLANASFDAVVSISVFSHLCEADQLMYLAELRRVSRPGALLFLSVHGERALNRAFDEDFVFTMLSIPKLELERTRRVFEYGSGFHFISQNGHLTTDAHSYGITFISERYIRSIWSRWFEIVEVISGSVHDFQDIVVLKVPDGKE